jgi:hypothetical protein
MTDATLPTGRSAERDFRIGCVLERASAVFSRNFMIFFVVTAVASLPTFLLLFGSHETTDDPVKALLLIGLGLFLGVVLGTLSQAVVLYGAFQDLRGRPIDLGLTLQVGLRRFLPIVGVAISVTLFACLGLVLFVVPGLIWFTKWFVAMPACVVEELGVYRSRERSAQLTEGHRWKIFGIIVLLVVADLIVDHAIDVTLSSVAGGVAALAGHVIWRGIWGAFYAIFAVVTYHDLRVAEDGVDIEQVAAVFE